jgi:ubiquinone/menaquinone biosynthesis C-methylase UbiE
MGVQQPAGRDARFTGSVPQFYDRYLGPLLFEDYAVDLAGRVREMPGSDATILEVAAGTGIATEQLRARVPSAVGLVATDLNPPMLAVAGERLARAGFADGVTFREADATSLPFEDASFDAVVCQFGVMFFPDKARAAAEAYRVLRPGGQWLFSVWGSWEENSFAHIVHETAAAFFSHDPPQFYRVPFSMADADELRALVEGAGFECRDLVTLDRTLEAPSAEEAATGLVRGNPLAAAIEERGGVLVDDVVAAVARRLGEEFGDRPIRVPSRVRVVDARRPG